MCPKAHGRSGGSGGPEPRAAVSARGLVSSKRQTAFHPLAGLGAKPPSPRSRPSTGQRQSELRSGASRKEPLRPSCGHRIGIGRQAMRGSRARMQQVAGEAAPHPRIAHHAGDQDQRRQRAQVPSMELAKVLEDFSPSAHTPCAFLQGRQLGPCDFGVHRTKAGKGAETAVRCRQSRGRWPRICW